MPVPRVRRIDAHTIEAGWARCSRSGGRKMTVDVMDMSTPLAHGELQAELDKKLAGLATKAELEVVEHRLVRRIEETEQRLVGQMHQLEQRMHEFEERMIERMHEFEQRMVERMHEFEERMIER